MYIKTRKTRIRICVVRPLRPSGEPGIRAFDVLRPALRGGEWHERVAAIWGLAGLGDARSIALLKAILKDERPTQVWLKNAPGQVDVPRVRPEAASALVSTGDDGAIDAVYEEYKVSPEIVDAEIDRGNKDSWKDLHFRTAAVDALAMSPKPYAYLKIIDILGGTDIQMRYEATRVLNASTKSGFLSEMDMPNTVEQNFPRWMMPRCCVRNEGG